LKLKQTFTALLHQYTTDEPLIAVLWTEVEQHYTHRKRYYHNLNHLAHLLSELEAIESSLQSWNTVLFSLFYHDIVYNTLKSDNEARSADLAVQRMQQIGVPEAMIAACHEQIIATKNHALSENPDTNLFTDADLAILGQPWMVYETYYNNIRKEYALYPDIVYNPGRKKVLQHFLGMKRIFKTPHFFDKYEVQARKNLERERDA
jgi:predicted metal-dependent HD superfamily phosphohydrolase